MEVRALVSRIFEELNDLSKVGEVDDVFKEYAVRWLLYAIHQDLLDALAMIVALLGLRKPPSYAGLADVLYERGLISSDARALVKQAAVNRNMLAHAYRSFTRGELMELRSWVLANIPNLLNQLTSMIEEKDIDPMAPNEEVSRAFARHGIVLAMLFGSRARGTAREDSDYDIAVLAKDTLNYDEAVGLIRDLANALNVPMDMIDLVDLSRAPNELIYAILRDGVVIYPPNAEPALRLIAHMYVRVLGESDLDYMYYRAFRGRASKNS